MSMKPKIEGPLKPFFLVRARKGTKCAPCGCFIEASKARAEMTRLEAKGYVAGADPIRSLAGHLPVGTP